MKDSENFSIPDHFNRLVPISTTDILNKPANTLHFNISIIKILGDYRPYLDWHLDNARKAKVSIQCSYNM